MMQSTALTISNGVQVVVPDSLDLITPYVLYEQHDWFEDEIKFLRHLLQPGQKVIDIGANYGVYTLSMAQVVGPNGYVWAFEPASTTADFLAEGIAANHFDHITLERSALSNTKNGTAQLSLNQNSELNELLRDGRQADASETVPLVTMDDRMSAYGWRDIDFVKIDAEGEEGNILKGGGRFFSELSPLVQYEVKAGDKVHMELVQAFAELGYAPYRLVPGLRLLAPFDARSPLDPYLLNLFCCKPDCARRLADRGYLVTATSSHTVASENAADGGVAERLGDLGIYHWRNVLAKLHYGNQLAGLWEQTMAGGRGEEVGAALALYAASKDFALSPGKRLGALEVSYTKFKTICENEPSYLRLSSLARVARDYGARAIAVNALGQLSNNIFRDQQINMGEPFLVAGERFDSISPAKENLGNWVLAAILEEYERLASYSSFYTQNSARQRLEIIHNLGFGSEEMRRRLSLLQKLYP